MSGYASLSRRNLTLSMVVGLAILVGIYGIDKYFHAVPLSTPIKIGVLLPLDCDLQSMATSIKNVTELAKADLLAKHGSSLHLEVDYQNGCTEDLQVDAIETFAKNKVSMVATFCLFLCDQILPLTDAVGILTLNATANPALVSGLRFAVSANLTSENHADNMAAFAFTNLGARRVMLMYADTSLGRDYDRFFNLKFEALGGKISSHLAINQNGQDPKATAALVTADPPDIIVAISWGIPVMFRVAIDAAPNGMILVDHNRTIMIANNSVLKTLGYQRAEIVGQSIEILVPEHYRTIHPILRSKYMENPVPRPMGFGRDLFARHKDGREIPAEISLAPTQTPDGPLIVVGINDLTERRAAEKAARKGAFELHRSNEELEQFAYVASHDLQEPLRKISNFVGLFKDKYDPILDETGLRYLGYMTDAARRGSSLIADLLTYSRVGRAEITDEEISLTKVIHTVINDFGATIKESTAQIEIQPLPYVKLPRSEMYQLFSNLIGNALKFRDPARPPHIEVFSTKIDSGLWQFSIRDN